MNAKQSLSSISANQELWLEQFLQEMFERDYRSDLSAAENHGRSEAKLEAARNMLLENDPIEKVARCLALPLETVQHLANEMKQ